jgi:DNA-binding MarR family transcriptional regulator
MKRRKGIEIMEGFIRLVNKYNALEKYSLSYGTRHKFYHSERHMLDKFGENPHMNITDIAEAAGVTKGAISQVASKLEKKGAVRRYKKSGNDKDVFVELKDLGKEIYKQHQRINEETIKEINRELRKYPEEKVEFLLHMFGWIDSFLDESSVRMKHHMMERD